MTADCGSGPNAAQIDYWNNEAGPKWVALGDVLDAQIAPLGDAAMAKAAIAHGDAILDVGCGCGQTSLALRRRAGRTGSVTGLDISTPMLERARERAREAGLPDLELENADAQTCALDAGSFDLIFSRFGVMFFSDPPAAFANLRTALAPGGRLAFVCWQALARNPWMLVPAMAVAPHVELLPPPAADDPGPFAFADPNRIRDILATAGFDGVSVDPLERELSLGGGGGLDAAVDLALQMGPAGRALRDADETARSRARHSVREALAPFATGDGVRMPCAAFVVTATHR